MKKSADEKSLIAAIVRAQTSVKATWVAERLQMGSVANVTRASKAIEDRLAGDRMLKRIQKEVLANISSWHLISRDRFIVKALYHEAKRQKKPMTKLADEIMTNGLKGSQGWEDAGKGDEPVHTKS